VKKIYINFQSKIKGARYTRVRVTLE